MDRWEQFNAIVDNENLNIKEKGLLLIIFRFINKKSGYANPSRTRIKKLAHITDNRTLDNIFNSLIEKGYLVRESGIGKRTKYYLKVGVETTLGVKTTLGVEITPILGVEITPTVGVEITPQKENKKENEKKNIYIEILNTWNSNPTFIEGTLTKAVTGAIDKLLTTYSESDILNAIGNYAEVLDSKYFFNYKWSLIDFLRKHNAINTFMTNGSNKIKYDNWLNSNFDDRSAEKSFETIEGNWGNYGETTT